MGVGLALPYSADRPVPSCGAHFAEAGRMDEYRPPCSGRRSSLTGAWLLWVLFRQAGIAATLGALAAAALLVIALMKSDGPRRWAMAAGAFVIGGVLVAALAICAKNRWTCRFAWAPFDRAEITRRVAQRRGDSGGCNGRLVRHLQMEQRQPCYPVIQWLLSSKPM